MAKPRWMPQPQLRYAQVVKSYQGPRLVDVKHRVVFGTREAIERILAKRGWTINTSFIERLNLDFRQHVAAIGRRVNTLCKHEAGLRQQLALFHVYHNFVLPHASLRVPLPELDAIPDRETLASADTGNGGWADRSGMELERGAHVSRFPVAAKPDVVAWGR